MASEQVESGAIGIEPGSRDVFGAIVAALAFVAVTRLPFARSGPMEADEWMFVERMDAGWLPAHHTLFHAAGRIVGMLVGGHYRGLVVLDMLVSALALVESLVVAPGAGPPFDGGGLNPGGGRFAGLLVAR